MPKKIEVVINRAKWRTGGDSACSTGKGDTELRNQSGYKCCLGFISKTVKPREKITGCGEPYELDIIIPEITEYRKGENGIIDNTELSNLAIGINDSNMLPKQKEKELKKLFAKSCYKLKFIGKYSRSK